jgi:hypothetical protein
MTDHASTLAACLDEMILVQERLLVAIGRQRQAIASGSRAAVEEAALAMESDVLRLGALESRRNTAAAALADALGCVSARWAVIREALPDAQRTALAPRVARVARLVRDLELANAVNGQLVRNELEVIDLSIRSAARQDPRTVTRAYSPGGRSPEPAPSGPAFLNLAA